MVGYSARPVFRCTGITLTPILTKPSVWTARRCHKCGTLGYEEGIGGSGDLFCTNSACGERITLDNRRQVLQPAGFVTDAHTPVTNNIETMKFIPVVPARVFVKAERVPLPNPLMGFMASGADGHVFQQSMGEGGHGYALCLSCGRASQCSMPPIRRNRWKRIILRAPVNLIATARISGLSATAPRR